MAFKKKINNKNALKNPNRLLCYGVEIFEREIQTTFISL
jgi:hypothetical protein